jgi:hypothetical protein
MVWEQLLGMSALLVKWIFLGGVAGLVIGIGGYFLLKKLGAYDWQWRASRWFRWATFAMMLLVCPLLFAAAGFFEGVLRGSEMLLREGPLATRVFPVLGNAGADAFMAIHLLARKLPDAVTWTEFPALSSDEFNAFRQGRTELDIADLRANIEAVADRSTDRLLASLRERILEQYPSLKGRVGERVVELMVNGGGRWLLIRQARTRLAQAGLGQPAELFCSDLESAAVRQGDPRTISHRELSAFLVEKVIVGGTLWQIRAHVRSQQMLLLGVFAVILLLPVLFFRTAEFIRRKRAGRTPE